MKRYDELGPKKTLMKVYALLQISKLQAVVQRQCEERQLLLKSVPK